MPSLPHKDDQIINEILLLILEKLERKEFEFPTLPQVASRVLALTTDPNADVSQLAALIEQDIVLTARIFQTSNSAAFGAHREIETVSQTVTWLGLDTVAGTAYALSVQSGVFDVHGYEQEVKGLWTHALAAGFYGKAIARRIGQNVDAAFLCGLLHEMAKPFVVHTVNQFQKQSSMRLPWAAVLSLFKDSSKEIGRQIAIEWEFPGPVKEAINLYQDHAFHLGTSAIKAAPITNLAHHLASHSVDPQTMAEDTLRASPVIKALGIPDDGIDGLLTMQDIIRTQVDTMLV